MIRPQWLRKRAAGLLDPSDCPPTTDLALRLKEEARLDAHRGCVNCLDWNQNGDLLASGSDDSTVIIWDVFRRRRQKVVNIDHLGNIFSVKFMPNTSDTVIATASSDCRVIVTNIYQSDSLMKCTSCHMDRVKRLAVHPSEPNLIWSASEDGTVLQYDIRQEHVCSSEKSNSLLIDLGTISDCLQAKCLAVNPLRSEMLAVGSNDIYNRLFDRRYIKHNAPGSSCTAYFAPGHLLKSNNRSNHIQTYGTTYLTFNSKGTELLASYHAEQVYLFDVYRPWECFGSFESTIKPLLLDSQVTRNSSDLNVKVNEHMRKLRETDSISQPNDEVISICDQLNQRGLVLPEINVINQYLSKIPNCPLLYRSRSVALQKRGWRGDDYQSLRDCCCALALDPLDSRTIYQLASCLIKLGDHDAIMELLKFLEYSKSEYSCQRYLEMACDALSNFRQQALSSGGSSLDSIHSNIFDPSESAYSVLERSSRYLARIKTSSSGQVPRRSTQPQFPCDFTKQYSGHCNMNTDIKEVSFFGPNDEFVVGGSDDGAFYIWDKKTTNILKAVQADHHILNCVQPNPRICMIATSGIETAVKTWSPNGSHNRDVKPLDARCIQNQKFISTDPLEAMMMMLYPGRESD